MLGCDTEERNNTRQHLFSSSSSSSSSLRRRLRLSISCERSPSFLSPTRKRLGYFWNSSLSLFSRDSLLHELFSQLFLALRLGIRANHCPLHDHIKDQQSPFSSALDAATPLLSLSPSRGKVTQHTHSHTARGEGAEQTGSRTTSD